MRYLVTGGTGFIGRFLVQRLLARRGTVYLLIRPESKSKVTDLREFWGKPGNRLRVIEGNLTEAALGVGGVDQARLCGKIDGFYHLAALYDLTSAQPEQGEINIRGTAHALELAASLKVGCFHHVSSIAVAGLYRGIFREDMFEQAEAFDHPYFYSKYQAEKLVREQQQVAWRIYRPGMVVGHSVTGEMDKIDGPYYLFKAIQKLRNILPQWFPTIGLEGGRISIVPVDYVASALDYISHAENEDYGCFHLTDPDPLTIGEALNLFAEVGHAPRMAVRFDTQLLAFIPPLIRQSIGRLGPLRKLKESLFNELNIPVELVRLFNYPTLFDNRQAERVLAGTDISVPPLRQYAAVIWDYWERHLDPDLFREQNLREVVENKLCLVTGASSGIGESTARMLAKAGAHVCLAARSVAKLEKIAEEIRQAGGKAAVYPVDLNDLEACDRLVEDIESEHGVIDILINNAGRSIRRSMIYSLDRFHDYERTMQLNYFAPVRLTNRVIPGMLEQRSGHIINISSMGVLAKAPRFSAYIASKAALEAFSRCVGAELRDQNIRFTCINMPLVRTPMISPTRQYESLPALTPEQAAEFVAEALIKKPSRIATRLGIFAAVVNALSPQLAEIIMSIGYKLFAEEHPSGTEESPETKQHRSVLVALLKGVYW